MNSESSSNDKHTLAERLRHMADRNGRHEYTIGNYWNVCEEAADRIKELEHELSASLAKKEEVVTRWMNRALTAERELELRQSAPSANRQTFDQWWEQTGSAIYQRGMGYEVALAAWRAAPPATQRSSADYAIEHGKYLADAAERFMDALNQYDLLADPESPPVTPQQIEAATEARSEAWSALRSAIYEFRKRADRASAPSSIEPTIRERDLAMMIRRLAARLRIRATGWTHETADYSLCDSAHDLLVKHGIDTSPLRDEPKLTQSAPSAMAVEAALLKLHRDLNTLEWTGADEGWELAIKAVRADILKRVVARSATTGSGTTTNGAKE